MKEVEQVARDVSVVFRLLQFLSGSSNAENHASYGSRNHLSTSSAQEAFGVPLSRAPRGEGREREEPKERDSALPCRLGLNDPATAVGGIGRAGPTVSVRVVETTQ